MLQDQKEIGLIESISDGIARIIGLDKAFYSELLCNINPVEKVNIAQEEECEILSSVSFPDSTSLVIRALHDLLLPAIFLNSPEFKNNFKALSVNTMPELENEIEEIQVDSEIVNSFKELMNCDLLKTENVDNINVDINVVNNLLDFLEDSDFFEIVDNIIDVLATNEEIVDAADFAIAYVSMINQIVTTILNSLTASDAQAYADIQLATKNYLNVLAQTLSLSSMVSLLSPEDNEFVDEELSEEDIDDLDEVDEEEEIEDDLFEADEEGEAETTKTLLLVMGLEREYIQAGLLTQTTNIFEGDLVWRTSQELEIYCSFDALGKISDIFLNPLQ